MYRTTNAILLALALSACADDPGKDKVAATVQEPATEVQEAAKDAPAPATTGTEYKVDAAQSSLSCVGAKITAEHPIVFHAYDAAITVADGAIQGVSYTADMSKIEADHPKLTEHLLNEDFFWVEKFPTSSFSSKTITAGAEGEGMTHTVTGDLTIRGQTKQISFPAAIALTDTQATASSEFVINRQDFGVTYPGRKDDLIKDNVLLKVQFVAPLATN